MTDSRGTNVDYYGYKSLMLENEALRVIVTPEVGAKIVSLYDKRTGREWLVTPEQTGRVRPNDFQAWPYRAEYNPNQCGGWDEMIPTIVACPYPGEGPNHGTPLPDHGEAWTLPWQDFGSTDSEIVLELGGRALPYRLRRAMSLQGNALVLAYMLHNEGSAPLAYLWAAHPQFACDPGARIVLPDGVIEVVNVLPIGWAPEFGPARHAQCLALFRRRQTRRVPGSDRGAGEARWQEVLSPARRTHRVGRAAAAVWRVPAHELGRRLCALLWGVDRRRVPESGLRHDVRANKRLLR